MAKLAFSGPAHCFDSEEEAFEPSRTATTRKSRFYVIRYEGPKGGPGMREMLSTTAAMYGQAWATSRADHRRALLGRHARLLHWPCRPVAAIGGRSAS